jgi:hypothetical protein
MPKPDKNGPRSNAKISETSFAIILSFIAYCTSSKFDCNLFLPTSRPLLPRGYHFFAAATETLVDAPALATFFSA